MRRALFISLLAASVCAAEPVYHEFNTLRVTNGTLISNVPLALDCSECLPVSGFAVNGSPARGSSPDCYTVTFQWDAYGGNAGLVSGSDVFRSLNADMSGSSQISFEDLVLENLAYSDTGVHTTGPQPNTTYYYVLETGFNNGCPSQDSVTNQVDVGCYASASTGVGAGTVTATTVEVSWTLTDSLPAVLKQTVRWGTASGVYTDSQDVAKDATAYTIEGLTTAVEVFFVVDINDGNGCTARSNEGSATPE